MSERVDEGGAVEPWQAELPAHGLGAFEWNVTDDVWSWCPSLYALHGYHPDEVPVDVDLVVGHKLAEDRRRAERILSHAAVPGFRFRNLHGIHDRHGRERVVLSVGAVEWRTGPDRVRRQVLRGSMCDLTEDRGDLVRRLDRVPTDAGSEAPPADRFAGFRLSEREGQVLRLVGAGQTNEEIARELFVSINTVKTYLRTAYRKIGVSRRSQAVLWVSQRR